MRKLSLLSLRLVSLGRCFLLLCVVLTCTDAKSYAQEVRSSDDAERERSIQMLEKHIDKLQDNIARSKARLEEIKSLRPDGERTTKSASGWGPKIVNGVETNAFPASGAVLVGANPDEAGVHCSGTLIGCRTFLSAAHCFAKQPDPKRYFVYLQHAGVFRVKAISIPKEYAFPTADVAVLALDGVVEGIVPLPINREANPQYGADATLVGFGRTGGNVKEDYGIKRRGQVVTSSCVPPRSNEHSVCWRFDGEYGLPGEDSNSCNVDSGGGLHVGANLQIIGVTSGGSRAVNGQTVYDCLKGDRSFNANVFRYSKFIADKAGSDLQTQSCGQIAPVSMSNVRGGIDALSETTQSRAHRIDVAEGMSRLIVSMNGENWKGTNYETLDNPSPDFDLYLLRGEEVDDAKAVCRKTGSGQFASCEVKSPQPGRWTILVKRKVGAGQYQWTASWFQARQ
jgi:hypothetical protein